ncbi:MAG: acyltransferase [Bacteriovoracaceae bacterium]|nr:acyltransferase [Bacteriovoracaceae bacterium]
MKEKVKDILRKIRITVLILRGLKTDKKNHIEKGVVFEYPKNIALRPGVRVSRNSILKGNSSLNFAISVGANTQIMEQVLLCANEGVIRIGNNSWIGPQCLIYGNGHVRIGDHVMIAAKTSINTVSHNHAIIGLPMNLQGINTDRVTIEDDVWIGLNATILQGVTIGKGSIIGAGAVVTKDIPPYSIAVGTPAKVISTRNPKVKIDSVLTREISSENRKVS